MLNNSQLTIKKIVGVEYAYITTSEGGDKIYCNISRNSQWMKSYQIVFANAELGIGDPIRVRFNGTSIEELAKLCDCGTYVDGNTLNNISKFLIEKEKSIPTISIADELSLEGALKYLQEYSKILDDRTDEYTYIPTDTFREFAEAVGIAQSKFKKYLKRCEILAPSQSELYRYKKDDGSWVYRIKNDKLESVIKEMRELYA